MMNMTLLMTDTKAYWPNRRPEARMDMRVLRPLLAVPERS